MALAIAYPERALKYACVRRARFVGELADFVRFGSVSAQPEQACVLVDCATWLARNLNDIGLEHVAMVSTKGHPIVYADWLHLPGRPTLLIYGHYDVQPADPLRAWQSPPFKPTIRGNALYGRGASDDKGQMFVHVKAIESYLRSNGSLPVNVRCLFEGEEEIGSPNLPAFLERHRHALVADVAVVSDMRMLGPGRPVLTESLRGGLSLELEVRGPEQDLHSGNFGGAVLNPVQALCEIIARLHDSQDRIAIPGFYDGVRQLSPAERQYMTAVGPSDAEILTDTKAERGWGEAGYSLYERTTIRPALTINGISGGYQGPGIKAVIPARASAKFNFRLVPDQDPGEIDTLFREFIARIAPPAVSTHIRTLLLAYPAVVRRDHPAVQAAAIAYRKGFGKTPVFLRVGGTVPVIHLLQTTLGLPTVLMGFALPDDRLHAPNEKFHLPQFFKGMATSIWFLAELAKMRTALANAPCPDRYGETSMQ